MTSAGSNQKIDEKAFEKLFREYFYPLLAFACRIIRDKDDSKDIVHNVFVNLWERRDNIHQETSLKSWLFTSVNNRCLNFIRDNKKFYRNDVISENINDPSTWEDHLVASEIDGKIQNALDALPEACRKIFLLSRMDGLKYHEIAEKLGISEKTVETQMSRALKSLRERLKDLLITVIIICANWIL